MKESHPIHGFHDNPREKKHQEPTDLTSQRPEKPPSKNMGGQQNWIAWDDRMKHKSHDPRPTRNAGKIHATAQRCNVIVINFVHNKVMLCEVTEETLLYFIFHVTSNTLWLRNNKNFLLSVRLRVTKTCSFIFFTALGRPKKIMFCRNKNMMGTLMGRNY